MTAKTTPQTSAGEANPFEEFVERYYSDPVLFVREVLGVEPMPYQCDLLEAVAQNKRKISVRSGHGTGKSSASSWLMLWYLFLRYPCKIVVTAPTSGQLFNALFAELKTQIDNLSPHLQEALVVKSDRVELASAPSEAFISARTSRAETPEALAGVHSDNVLLVVDEASGVPESVFEAASGSMSGHSATTLLLSNPTRSSGTFFETHNRLRDSWHTLHWSCEKSPLVSDAFVTEMAERYGEQSNAYLVRVKGDFPRADDSTIIPYHLVQSAIDREIEIPPDTKPIWALDVARFGSDRTAFLKRSGNVVTEIMTWRGLDLMQTVGRVLAEYESLQISSQPSEILVDSIGIGSGVVDRLRELGLPVRGINVSEAPSMKGTYLNLRSELWFKLKEFLEDRSCKLPRNDDLITDLTGITYSFTSSGKLAAEPKDKMKSRGIKSPDLGDALCLSLAGQATTALSGSNLNWNRPIKRNLKGLV